MKIQSTTIETTYMCHKILSVAERGRFHMMQDSPDQKMARDFPKYETFVIV